MERTYLRCYVYACPEEERDAAATAMEFANMEAPEDGPWVNEDAPVDSAARLAAALREAAPGASWVLWEDPAGGTGTLCARTPKLGDFSASCDGGGCVLLTHDEISKVIAQAGTAGIAIAAAFDRAMGKPWMDDWTAHCEY